MNRLKVLAQFCSSLRHHPKLEQSNWLWDRLRPLYISLSGWEPEDGLSLLQRKSIVRVVNGTDRILLLPNYRLFKGNYEPEVWDHVMSHLRSDDVVADVGAYVGYYAICIAKRLRSGRVVAFEPMPQTFKELKKHVAINHVRRRVELIQAAVIGTKAETVAFGTEADITQFHINPADTEDALHVRAVRLDDVFKNQTVNILKVDVEGYEEEVLKSGLGLLQDKHRSPRLIYIEVHPYAWSAIGTTSQSLLTLLRTYQYRVETMSGEPVQEIQEYGEIVAIKQSS